MKKSEAKDDPIIKTTIRPTKSLWAKVRHLAIDEGVSAEAIVLKAVAEYVKKGGR